MCGSEVLPSSGVLEAVRGLAGPWAAIVNVARLEGGQHADTWRVDTKRPALSVVVREFPVGDPAGAHEQLVLRMLDGLGGLAPVLLDGFLDGRWSDRPTSVISLLDGRANITPADPDESAAKLGRALAAVHAVTNDRLAALPSVFDRRRGVPARTSGPAGRSRSRLLGTDRRGTDGAHPHRLLVRQRRLAGGQAHRHRRLVERSTRSPWL